MPPPKKKQRLQSAARRTPTTGHFSLFATRRRRSPLADKIHNETQLKDGPYWIALLVSDHLECWNWAPPRILCAPAHSGRVAQQVWNEYRLWCDYNGRGARVGPYPTEVSWMQSRDDREGASSPDTHAVLWLNPGGSCWSDLFAGLTHVALVAGRASRCTLYDLGLEHLPDLVEVILVLPGLVRPESMGDLSSFLEYCPNLRRLVVDGTPALTESWIGSVMRIHYLMEDGTHGGPRIGGGEGVTVAHHSGKAVHYDAGPAVGAAEEGVEGARIWDRFTPLMLIPSISY
jgi:hypothetical protein